MQAYSVKKVIEKKFSVIEFSEQWLEAVGKPELSGSWSIGGLPKNGKTTFALMLAKYMARFDRVAYNSIEEGLTLSFQMALKRQNVQEAGSRIIVLNRESIDELEERLKRHKSPNIIIIDSIQFAGLTFETYKKLKEKFKNKLFIYITHLKGEIPEGSTAVKIWRDSNVVFMIKGFKAFPTSRYGGGREIVINEELAAKFWLSNN
jgi:hypothetical protein